MQLALDFLRENAGRLVLTVVVLLLSVGLWRFFVYAGHRAVARVSPEEGLGLIERKERIDTLWTVARRVAMVLVIVLVALTLMAVWSIPIAPLVVVGSAVGLAVGFGAQTLVRDVIAGFFILIENQYSIGDVVRVADIAGRVEDIQLRVTVLRDLSGNVHYVPNGEIKVTSNYTQEFGRVVADIGVAYKESVDRVIEVLADEARSFYEDEEWSTNFPEEPSVLGVEAFDDSAVMVRVLLTVSPPINRWMVKREFYRRVKNRLDAEGIEIPFPHRTLYLGGPEEWRSVLADHSSSTPTTSSTS